MTIETPIGFDTVVGVCFFVWGDPDHIENAPNGPRCVVWYRKADSPEEGHIIVADDGNGILIIAGTSRDLQRAEMMTWQVPSKTEGDAVPAITAVVAMASEWMLARMGSMPLGPIFSNGASTGRAILDQKKLAASSCVYFIQADVGGPIKIGRSGNVDERVTRLQTANACPLRIIARMPGKAAVEKNMHALFAKDRIRPDGEWFRPSAELIAFIREIGGVV